MRRAGLPGASEWERRLAAAAIPAQWIPGLVVYVQLLLRFQDTLDLVAPSDTDTLLNEHILESLAGAEHLAGSGKLLDAGSGAGLPGIPLLIARSAWRGTLLEPRERRWAFLREVVRETGLECEVRRARVAQVQETYDALTVRALAVREWGESARRLVREGGQVLWWTATEEPRPPAGFEPVVTSPLPVRQRGSVVVLVRRST